MAEPRDSTRNPDARPDAGTDGRTSDGTSPVVNSNPAEPDAPPAPSPLQLKIPRDAHHAPQAGTEPVHVEEMRGTANPKLDPDPGSNTVKDPDDWVSGDEPMTGAQASYLRTLSEQAHENLFEEGLTKAEASRRIDALKARQAGD